MNQVASAGLMILRVRLLQVRTEWQSAVVVLCLHILSSLSIAPLSELPHTYQLCISIKRGKACTGALLG